LEVTNLAEVRLQEGKSIESALRRFKRKAQTEDIIKEVKASLLLPEARREASSEASLGAKAGSQEDSQRARLSWHGRVSSRIPAT
jgi:ribosomal protein S21